VTKTPKKPVTIYNVAKHVGVSPAAVSAVLSNRHEERGFSASTVERIRRGIRDLGYIPNMEGRRLRTRKTGEQRLYLALLTSYEAPFFLTGMAMRVLQKIIDQRTSATLKFYVSIELFHAGRLKEIQDVFESSRFHGVIVTNTVVEDDRFLAATTPPFHSVILGRSIPNYCCVLEEPNHAGRRAAQLLVRAGHRKLAVLCPALLTQTTSARVDAFCTTVQSLSGKQPLRVTSVDFSPAAGAAALQSLLEPKPVIDGVFVVTDTLAVGAYQAIKSIGARIGSDISVVGIGDHEFSGLFDPPLTCVSPFNYAATEQAVRSLLLMMENSSVPPGEIFVPPRAMENTGSSVRPPAG